jgi:hypothetical protein
MRLERLIIFQNQLLNRLLNTVQCFRQKNSSVEKILKKKVSKKLRNDSSEAINHIKVMIEKVAQRSQSFNHGSQQPGKELLRINYTKRASALISFNRSKLCCYSIRIDRK